MRLSAYAQLGLCDVSPPRTTDHVPTYPVRVWVDIPPSLDGENLSIVVKANMEGFGALRWYPRFLAMMGAVGLAWFAVLVTGRYPRGLFDFVVRSMSRVFGIRWIVVPAM